MRIGFAALTVFLCVWTGSPVAAQETKICALPPPLSAIDADRLTIDIGGGEVCIVATPSDAHISVYANDRDVAYTIDAEYLGDDVYLAANGDTWRVYSDTVTVSDDQGVIWTGVRRNEP